MTAANILINYEALYAHQVQYYTERLMVERARTESDEKTKAVAFLREQLHNIKIANWARNN
jgi:hypothetical protein